MVCFVFDIEIVFVVFLKIVCFFCECFLGKKNKFSFLLLLLFRLLWNYGVIILSFVINFFMLVMWNVKVFCEDFDKYN